MTNANAPPPPQDQEPQPGSDSPLPRPDSPHPKKIPAIAVVGGVALLGLAVGLGILLGGMQPKKPNKTSSSSESQVEDEETTDPVKLAQLFAKHILRGEAKGIQASMEKLETNEGNQWKLDLGEKIVEELKAAAGQIEAIAGDLTEETLMPRLNEIYSSTHNKIAAMAREMAGLHEGEIRKELLSKAAVFERLGKDKTRDRPWTDDGKLIDTNARWLDSWRPVRAKTWVRTLNNGKAGIYILNLNEFDWTTVKVTLNGEFSYSRPWKFDGLVSKRFFPKRVRARRLGLQYFQNANGQKFGYTNARGIESVELTTKHGRNWSGTLSPPP